VKGKALDGGIYDIPDPVPWNLPSNYDEIQKIYPPPPAAPRCSGKATPGGYHGFGDLSPPLKSQPARDVSFMTAWDLGPETAAMYPAFTWEIGTTQTKRMFNGYMGVQCVYGKLNTVLFSVWDACGTAKAPYPCYTNFGKSSHGPTPQKPHRQHLRPAPQHPNCMRNCQDCGGAKATGTKCMLRDELQALALPCAGKYEMRVRMTHPQRTAKFSSAIDAHTKEYSVTGAEFTVTFHDLEREMGYTVAVVVFGGVPPTGGFTSIGTFYEFYAGSTSGCETTTSESRSNQCTNRVTRELIFNDAPRTLVGATGDTAKESFFPPAKKCDLNNAYALRRGLVTVEYSPGLPKMRGFTYSSSGKLVVPYSSPYVPDANGNLRTPQPTPGPTPPTPLPPGWTEHPDHYLGGYVRGVGARSYLAAEARSECLKLGSSCGGVTCKKQACTLRAGRTPKRQPPNVKNTVSFTYSR
jgi:hypothetical protein